jgi:hypothetical protein
VTVVPEPAWFPRSVVDEDPVLGEPEQAHRTASRRGRDRHFDAAPVLGHRGQEHPRELGVVLGIARISRPRHFRGIVLAACVRVRRPGARARGELLGGRQAVAIVVGVPVRRGGIEPEARLDRVGHSVAIGVGLGSKRHGGRLFPAEAVRPAAAADDAQRVSAGAVGRPDLAAVHAVVCAEVAVPAVVEEREAPDDAARVGHLRHDRRSGDAARSVGQGEHELERGPGRCPVVHLES